MNVETLKRRSLRTLVVIHRWLGIGGCLLFAAWFLSGLVMLYVGFPDLTSAERTRYEARIDWTQVGVTPGQILRAQRLSEFPRDFRLEMSGGHPVYRLTAGGRRLALSAIDGKAIDAVSAPQARVIATTALDNLEPVSVTTLERDQWTVAGTFEGHRPLHRVEFLDPAGTHLYVSSRTGEIMLDSTARERTWNWLGSVIHWIYFTELRTHAAVWSQVVKWVSALCIFVAITGLWLGIDRLRVRRRSGSFTPFRGWMAWHHVFGVIGGLFVLTWIFSGWLSMGPSVPWNSEYDPERRAEGLAVYAGHEAPTFDVTLDRLRALNDRDVREATFAWVMGKPQITLLDSTRHAEMVNAVSGEPLRWSRDGIASAAGSLVPGAKLMAMSQLEQEDAYWYSSDSTRVLPVLRFEYDDEERTWVHIDPSTARIVGWSQSGDRVQRWLFDALHTLDFLWLVKHDAVRLALIWLLSALGLTICVSGIVIGWRRLRA